MKNAENITSKNALFQLQQSIEESLYNFKLNKKYEKVSLQMIDDLIAPLSVIGDKKNLKKIFEILLSNAADLVKASKITITIKQLLQTEKEVLIEFTIEDDGLKKGFDESNKYYSYRRGLVAARTLIEKNSGKAEISSLTGVGTTVKFLVKFNMGAQANKGKSTRNLSASNKLSGKNILIAEDNEINQKIIAHILRKENINVDIANDGREAVELFEKNGNYDLLIIDIQMPHMDGVQAANYIRKKLKSNVPIIAMTASAFPNEQMRCFEVGINQYLSKPFPPDELFHHLRYFLLEEHDIPNQKFESTSNSTGLYSYQELQQNNDRDYLVEILEMFIEKTPDLLSDIRQAIEEQNWVGVLQKTAKLKGSLGSLKMQTMMKVVEEIESRVNLLEVNDLCELVSELNEEYEEIYPMLESDLRDMKRRPAYKL